MTGARIIAVTGMHRSGTSLATRIMQLAGLSLGRDDGLAPAGRDNPAGYWENRYVTELNDEILAALGGSWDQPPVLDDGWQLEPVLDPFRDRLRELIERYFAPAQADGHLVGCKDPRLSILMPLWRTVVDIPTSVVLVRRPNEVAASLHTRNAMEAPQVALLWMRYLLGATRNDPGALLLTQDTFFSELRPTLDRITDHLGLPRADAACEEQARAHLDPTLRHHRAADPVLDGDNPLVTMADAMWNNGRIDLAAFPPAVIDGIARGWIRPPIDTLALAVARAKAVELEETLRKRNRRERAQAPGQPQPSTP